MKYSLNLLNIKEVVAVMRDPKVTLFDLILCLSTSMDLVSTKLVNHHKQVAYIASSIAMEMSLDKSIQHSLVLAGALHDIGALSYRDRIRILDFDVVNSEKHTILGSQLIKSFEPLAFLSDIIRYHHLNWKRENEYGYIDDDIIMQGSILHLSDRVAVSIDKNKNIKNRIHFIKERIKGNSGKLFSPKIVDAFLQLATKEEFWTDLQSESIDHILKNRVTNGDIILGLEQLKELSGFFSRIIDFRSSFTATHSSGVAATAKLLSIFLGFSHRDSDIIAIAGNLHDLGKLAVPNEILEKPGALNAKEFEVMRKHALYTYNILNHIEGFDIINSWASLHHERINGTGYPFGLKGDEISLGTRIMAVCDVFTALAEDRPYRKGMKKEEIIIILNKMAERLDLDSELVNIVVKNFHEFNYVRFDAQANSINLFNQIVSA